MAQFARPDSDVSETNWNGVGSSADKWANIDEASASDTDYDYSTNNTSGAVLEVGLTDVTDPLSSSGHTVRYRVAQTNAGTLDGGGTAVTLTIQLIQNTTVIAGVSGVSLTGSWADGSFTLSGAEADAITDYTDLRIRVTTSGGGGSPANRRGGAISWAELETPDEAAPPSTKVIVIGPVGV